MTVTIRLTPDLERELTARAEAQGVSPDAYAATVLKRDLEPFADIVPKTEKPKRFLSGPGLIGAMDQACLITQFRANRFAAMIGEDTGRYECPAARRPDGTSAPVVCPRSARQAD